MMRYVFRLGLAGLLWLVPAPMAAGPEPSTDGGNLERSGLGNAAGFLVVEVLEISDLTPVQGVRVELLPSGRIVRTNADGRATFRLGAGSYDLRVHDLTGPGPAIRVDEVHADVVPRQTVVIQVLDCGSCL
jgi:hypothetical protein